MVSVSPEVIEDVRARARAVLTQAVDLYRCPTDVLAVAASLGIHVVSEPFPEQPDFDGVAVLLAEHPMIILNSLRPRVRRAFTLAHEIGHLVLSHRSSGSWVQERLANIYASELLMPTPRLYRQLCCYGADVVMLAVLNGVSRQAMEIRLREFLGTLIWEGRDDRVRVCPARNAAVE